MVSHLLAQQSYIRWPTSQVELIAMFVQPHKIGVMPLILVGRLVGIFSRLPYTRLLLVDWPKNVIPLHKHGILIFRLPGFLAIS